MALVLVDIPPAGLICARRVFDPFMPFDLWFPQKVRAMRGEIAGLIEWHARQLGLTGFKSSVRR